MIIRLRASKVNFVTEQRNWEDPARFAFNVEDLVPVAHGADITIPKLPAFKPKLL